MSKNFFVVIPYAPVAVNLKKEVTIILSKRPTSAIGSDARFEEQRIQLEQRVSLVAEGLARIGVRTIALQQDELVELFYHIYNPSDPTGSAPVLDN